MHVKSAPRSSAPLLAALLASLLLSAPALAQDKPATKAPAKSSAKPPAKGKANLMTRDELRACMDEQDQIQLARAKITQEQAVIDQQKARIQAWDADRQRRAAALDPADEAGRKAIEEDVLKRDEEAVAFNTRLAALREQAAVYEAGRQGWLQRCTTKDFDEMDEAAIKKERAQAARGKK